MVKKSFKQLVYEATQQIPAGETKTYKEIAILIGHPKAYRAVGNVLHQNERLDVPCHRVIRSDSQTGSYRYGSSKKQQILAFERTTKQDWTGPRA